MRRFPACSPCLSPVRSCAQLRGSPELGRQPSRQAPKVPQRRGDPPRTAGVEVVELGAKFTNSRCELGSRCKLGFERLGLRRLRRQHCSETSDVMLVVRKLSRQIEPETGKPQFHLSYADLHRARIMTL